MLLIHMTFNIKKVFPESTLKMQKYSQSMKMIVKYQETKKKEGKFIMFKTKTDFSEWF